MHVKINNMNKKILTLLSKSLLTHFRDKTVYTYLPALKQGHFAQTGVGYLFKSQKWSQAAIQELNITLVAHKSPAETLAKMEKGSKGVFLLPVTKDLRPKLEKFSDQKVAELRIPFNRQLYTREQAVPQVLIGMNPYRLMSGHKQEEGQETVNGIPFVAIKGGSANTLTALIQEKPENIPLNTPTESVKTVSDLLDKKGLTLDNLGIIADQWFEKEGEMELREIEKLQVSQVIPVENGTKHMCFYSIT